MSRAPRLAAVFAAALVLLVGIYAVAGFWGVPRLLRGELETTLAETLSVEVEVGALRFDPFRLRLEADGFWMGGAAEAPEASVRSLRIDVAVAPLFGRRVVVDELSIIDPTLVMRIDPAGVIQIAGVSLGRDEPEEPAADEPAAEEEGDGEAPLADLRVASLSLSGGTFLLVDASGEEEIVREIGPIELRANDLSLTDLLRSEGKQADSTSAELAMALPEGASLSLRGDIDVDPLRLALQLELAELPVASLQPYIERTAAVELRDGRLAAKGELRIGTSDEQTDGLRFDGELALRGLEVVDLEGDPLIGWDVLELAGIGLVTEPFSLAVASVKLAKPRVHVIPSAAGLNLAAAFGSAAGDRPSKAEPAAPPSLAIGPIHVSSGAVRFEDRSVEPAYHVDVEDLDVKLDGFRMNPGGRSSIALSSELDGYAPLKVDGALAPLSPREDLDLALSIAGLELESFSPYAGRYVGRRIDAGRGSFALEMKVVERSMTSSTKITLDALGFGEDVDSPDATSLPVATATALLKDADGRIALDIPIAGDFDDPDFSYRGQLLATLRTLVTRVVATPYKLVDGMVSFGGRLFRPEDMSRVAFDPEDHDLSRGERTKLEALAVALRENPELSLEIQGGASPDLDGDTEDLRRLARRRARSVRKLLVQEGVSEERILTGEVRIDAVTAGPDGQVQVALVVR